MLKLKADTDLKELKKLGFIYYKSENVYRLEKEMPGGNWNAVLAQIWPDRIWIKKGEEEKIESLLYPYLERVNK